MILLRPWFLVLAIVPLLLFHAKSVSRIGAWKKICDEHLLPYLSVKVKGRKNTFYKRYLTILWVWLVLAASGPAFLQKQQETFSEKKAVVLVLDLSPAMTESLLSEARFKLFDFLKTTQADVGFVISDTRAYTVVPITQDKGIIQQVIPTVNSSVVPLPGSAPEKGLQRAESLLKQAGYTHGQILLLTAGIVHPDAFEKVAQDISYPIVILGFGESTPHPILWKKDFWKDTHGTPYQASLNSDMLNKVGFYQKSMLDNKDLDRISQQVGDMELTQTPVENYQDIGVWLVLLALPFVAVLFRRGLLFVLVLSVLSMPAQAGWFERQEQETYALQKQGIQAYRQKNYAEAEQLFQAADDLYNQANARAMQSDFAGAIELYEQELALHPDNEDARFNLDYLKELLRQQPPSEKSEQQEENQKDNQQNNDQQQQGADQQKDNQQGEQQNGEQNSEQNSSQSEEQKSGEDTSELQNNEQNGQQKQSEEQADGSQDQQDNQQQQTQTNATPSDEDKNTEQAEGGALEEQNTSLEGNNFEKQQQLQWLGKIEPDVSGLLRYRLRKQAEEDL